MPHSRPRRLAAALLLASFLTGTAAAVPSVEPVGVFHPWAKAEFRIDGMPAAENNFDPDQIAVDATFTSPSGRTLTVPAFWYQDFTGSLEQGAESVSALGAPRWLLRYTPAEPGQFRLVLRWRLAGKLAPDAVDSTFTVVPGPSPGRTGWVRVGPDHRYFETSDGRPLRFIGANVCWPEEGGTRDYARWFGRMAAAGENYARLWLCPWWAGIEHKPGTLNRYSLADAWRLDRVFDLADENGIYVLLSLDHHGMYQVVNKGWGGKNNFWPTNPYSSLQGGPCAAPDDFFTSAVARDLYRKRLRYLVARFGYSPRLVAWQFFNEIDNIFTQGVNGADVVAWHRDMGDWLRANDPYGHLITTSLTGGSDRPEVWSLPELDFSEYHSYVDPALGAGIAALSDDFVLRYRKPVMIGEYGVSAATWSIAQDPYLRGFRQGLWSGALGGSAGTSMSWWWQDIDKDDVYPLYAVLARVLGDAGWGSGAWAPAALAPRSPLPSELAPHRPGTEEFDAALALNTGRRLRLPGTAVIASPLAAERSSERLSAYLYGAKNPDLAQGLRVTADFAKKARIVVWVKAAASDNDLVVRIGGAEVFRRHFARSDAKLRPGTVRAVEFEVGVPSGRQTLEIANAGPDFTLLESVRLERVCNVGFAGGWDYGPEVAALRSGNKAVVYVTSPWVVYPAGALLYHPPQVAGASITILSWPDGPVRADWFSPVDGRSLGTTSARVSRGAAAIPVPDFTEDVVGVVRSP